MNPDAFRREAERHGYPRALANGVVRRLHRWVYVRLFKAIVLQAVNPKFLTCDPRYVWERVAPARLRALSADPVNELDAQFLDVALAKGDECFGFFDSEVLASYGWYSSKPTEMDAPGFEFRFDSRFIYMYKGYTHRDHRGHRLHAVGMTRALQTYLDRGFRGLVSTVEWQNSDSLKSCYRLGYLDFGKVYGLRIFGRYYFRSGRGCERYQFGVDRLSQGDRPPPAAG